MLRDTVTQLLKQSDCHYSVDSDGDIVVLQGQPDGQVEAYHILLPEGDRLIQFMHIYLPVPRSRAADVALTMAELNATYRFGTLSLKDGLAMVDLSLVCDFVTDVESHVGTLFALFLKTVEDTRGTVRQAVLRRRSRPSRLERDIAEAFRNAESAAS